MNLPRFARLALLLIGLPAFAHRPGHVQHHKPAFDRIWATNRGRTIEIASIDYVADGRPSPYRISVEFLEKTPMIRFQLFRDGARHASRVVKPFGGGFFNQKWVTYKFEADGLIFQVGINTTGGMPVNVFKSAGDVHSLMFGKAQLEGAPGFCETRVVDQKPRE